MANNETEAARLRQYRRDHPEYRKKESARMRAMTRLRHMYPSPYKKLYDEELGEAGAVVPLVTPDYDFTQLTPPAAAIFAASENLWADFDLPVYEWGSPVWYEKFAAYLTEQGWRHG